MGVPRILRFQNVVNVLSPRNSTVKFFRMKVLIIFCFKTLHDEFFILKPGYFLVKIEMERCIQFPKIGNLAPLKISTAQNGIAVCS